MARDIRLNVIIDEDSQGLDRGARKLDHLGDEASQAARKIAELKAAQTALGAEFVRTGNIDVLKQFRQAGRDVRTFEGIGKALSSQVDKGLGDGGRRGLDRIAKDSVQEAEVVSKTFGNGILSGFMSLPPEIQAILGGAVVAAGPVIGAALSAAVLAGVGGSALGAGLLIAAQNPEVKAAGTELGQHLMAGLTQAAGPMVSAMLASISTLRAGFDSLQPAIARIFANISPYVDKLAQGLVGMFQQMMPGIESAVSAAGPLLGAIADEMPAIGQAISFFFQQVAQGGPGAVMFIRDFLQGMELLIGTLGVVIKWLSQAYFWISAFAHAMSGDFVTASVSAASAMKIAAAPMNQVADAAKNAHQALGELTNDFSALSDAGLGVAEAAIGWRTALAALSGAVKANGHDLRLSTAAGRANQQMIIDGVQAARRVYDANIKNHASINAATSAYRGQIATLRTHLLQLGFNKAAVDKLIVALAGVPPVVKTKAELATEKAHAAAAALQRHIDALHGRSVRVDANTGSAVGRVLALQAAIRGLYSRTITVTTNYQQSGGTVLTSSGQRARAQGGLMAAAQGAIISPAANLYRIAEPETGGEMAIPRLGISVARAAALIGVANRWHPQAAAQAGVGGGVDTAAIAAAVASGVAAGIAGVRVEMDGYLVGRMQGRRADLLARGG